MFSRYPCSKDLSPICASGLSIILLTSLFLSDLFYLVLVCVNVFPEGSVTDSDDDNERNDAAEEETDDDENAFFDTRDFLSSSSFKSSESDFQQSSFDSDDERYSICSESGGDASLNLVGFNYPHIRRRKKLPEPVEKEKGVSLWSMIKDNIGKDLTKVCLPVFFNEPLSSLQKCFEDLEYSFLVDRAYEWGKRVSSFFRIFLLNKFNLCS